MKQYPDSIDGLLVTHGSGQTEGVLSLTLNRPDRRNAITDDIVLGLIDLIEAAGSDETVRVIRVDGTGDHFCSGFDLSLRGGDDTKPRAGATQRQMRWHVNRLIPTMLETQTPIVTSVRGWAIGLGMNIALASDFVVAADDARFWAPFTQSGFTPDSGVSWMLPRLVGVARAKKAIMLAHKISGVEAADWGMIHASVPLADVAATADELTQELSNAATVAVGLSKLLIHRSLTVELNRHLEDEGLAIELSSRSDDFRESSRARREKRDPNFGGR